MMSSANSAMCGVLSTLQPVWNTKSGSSPVAFCLGTWLRRANNASLSCNRDNALTSRATARKPSTPARRCVAALSLAFAMATRAMPSKKRGLTP